MVYARALAPLRPAHLKARTRANGDIELSWTRRARHSADRLDMASVPLLEDSQLFQLALIDAGEVIRTVETPDTSWTYTAAMQTDDGYPTDEFTCKVSQISARVGAGAKAETVL